MRIILGSKSPRRMEILKNAGYSFDICESNFELDINGKIYSDSLLLKCVEGKYSNIKDKVFSMYSDDLLIITADTVVVYDDVIIGKPKDENDAINILSTLSGHTHFVATSIQLAYRTKDNAIHIKNGVEKTHVTFRRLAKQEILDYIKKSKPLDKAGAYGIQDIGFDFVKSIDGNTDNVIGFPMELFKSLYLPGPGN